MPFLNFPRTVEWNIAKIRADEAWSTFGIRGQGAVVGVIDTGVMYTHPALVNQYRGNLGNGVFNHNYSWFDFVSGLPVPNDDSGHGTFGMGIAVGEDGGVHQIGVAPDAQWIAVKACSMQFGCTLEDLHAALAWMLAPTDLAGGNPNPAMAPEVVLNMWGMVSYTCDHSFDPDIMALRAANILPVFAPGGEGSGCGTVALPAANPEALAAGATDSTDMLEHDLARVQLGQRRRVAAAERRQRGLERQVPQLLLGVRAQRRHVDGRIPAAAALAGARASTARGSAALGEDPLGNRSITLAHGFGQLSSGSRNIRQWPGRELKLSGLSLGPAVEDHGHHISGPMARQRANQAGIASDLLVAQLHQHILGQLQAMHRPPIFNTRAISLR